MTTTVTVKALHGWPVDVTVVRNGETLFPTRRVPNGEERDFYVHSGHDLLIHEVQPGEVERGEVAAKPATVTEGV